MVKCYDIRVLKGEMKFDFSEERLWYFFFVDSFLSKDRAWVLLDY